VDSKTALNTFRSQAWENSAAARKGKPLTEAHKIKLSESHRRTYAKKPPTRTVSLWSIAEDTLRGMTSTASAAKLDDWQADVYRQRKRMGLPTGYPGIVRHGEFLSFRHFEELCSDLGVTKKEAAQFAGLSYRSFANRISKKGRETPLSGKNPSDRSAPHVGRDLNAAIQKVVDRFCVSQGKRWKQRRFLSSELKAIQSKHPALERAAARLREAYKADAFSSDATAALEWLAWKATDPDEGDLRSALHFGLTFQQLLRSKSASLFAEDFRAGEFVDELLGLDYGAAANAIRHVVDGAAKPLDPETLRLAAVEFVRTAPEVAKANKRGHGPDPTPEEKTEWFDTGRRIEAVVNSKGLIAARKIVASQKHYQYDTAVRHHMRYRKCLKARSTHDEV
jgi:hypothetical protein